MRRSQYRSFWAQVYQTCNEGFNTADIVHGSYDMPAILPDRETCVLGKEKCAPHLLERTDDTPTTIKHRFEVHTQETEPVISYFRECGMLMTFDVKKGLKIPHNYSIESSVGFDPDTSTWT